MSTIVAKIIHTKAISAVRNITVDFQKRLRPGELLTGTPTVASPTGAAVASDIVINVAPVVIDEKTTIPIGMAVQFRIGDGGTAGIKYTYAVTVLTNGTPAQTFIAKVLLLVVSNT